MFFRETKQSIRSAYRRLPDKWQVRIRWMLDPHVWRFHLGILKINLVDGLGQVIYRRPGGPWRSLAVKLEGDWYVRSGGGMKPIREAFRNVWWGGAIHGCV